MKIKVKGTNEQLRSILIEKLSMLRSRFRFVDITIFFPENIFVAIKARKNSFNLPFERFFFGCEWICEKSICRTIREMTVGC